MFIILSLQYLLRNIIIRISIFEEFLKSEMIWFYFYNTNDI